jgi:hypothetical protein
MTVANADKDDISKTCDSKRIQRGVAEFYSNMVGYPACLGCAPYDASDLHDLFSFVLGCGLTSILLGAISWCLL